MSNKTEWYQLPAADVIGNLQADRNGLTSVEAESRLKKYGYNKLGSCTISKEWLNGERNRKNTGNN